MEPLEGEQTAQLNEHLIFGRCQLFQSEWLSGRQSVRQSNSRSVNQTLSQWLNIVNVIAFGLSSERKIVLQLSIIQIPIHNK